MSTSAKLANDKVGLWLMFLVNFVQALVHGGPNWASAGREWAVRILAAMRLESSRPFLDATRPFQWNSKVDKERLVATGPSSVWAASS
jgi:hypothetical protein